MSNRVNRALAAGVLVAALLPALTGCSTAAADSELEQNLSGLSGVNGAYVKTTTDGSPMNRGLRLSLFVEADLGTGLESLVDDALRTAWHYPAFEPTAGVAFTINEGQLPRVRPQGMYGEPMDLRVAFQDSPLIDVVAFNSSGTYASLSHGVMADRYGEWTGGN